MSNHENEQDSLNSVLPLGSLTATEMEQESRRLERDLGPDEWDQPSKLWVMIRLSDNSLTPCLLTTSTDHPSDMMDDIVELLTKTVADLHTVLGPLDPREIVGFMLYFEGWAYAQDVEASLQHATPDEVLEFCQAHPPKSFSSTDMAREIRQLTCVGGDASMGIPRASVTVDLRSWRPPTRKREERPSTRYGT